MPIETCPKCRHAAHGNVCLNMASDNDCDCTFNSLDLPTKDQIGSFKIEKMTMPANHWLWSLWSPDGKHMDLSKGGYKSPEAAVSAICDILKAVGADTEKVEIWIHKEVRTRANPCQK